MVLHIESYITPRDTARLEALYRAADSVVGGRQIGREFPSPLAIGRQWVLLVTAEIGRGRCFVKANPFSAAISASKSAAEVKRFLGGVSTRI
jgi:hypothetical protein